MNRSLLLLLALWIAPQVGAEIPATPVMTLYWFNGDLEIPYYGVDDFLTEGISSPAGTLAQGTSLIPCLLVKNGWPVTDDEGTPYVGFTVVLDAKQAKPADVEKLKATWEERQSQTVANHVCDSIVRYVIDVRRLVALWKAPFFDPPSPGGTWVPTVSANGLDAIIRAFHNSSHCAEANRQLVGRRDTLQEAWNRFAADNRGKWSDEVVVSARRLDFTMRTAIYEGNLERGCNAYGACERNIIALSIRNRALDKCLRRQGCRFPGDFEGVASSVSQYNIWDEYLTQTTGLTSCFLREDLVNREHYAKLQAIYAQNIGDVERILYAGVDALQDIFQGAVSSDVQHLRHYYHPPAMGQCFPDHERIEYISGAVARKGGDFALIANTRIRIDEKMNGGYYFRDFVAQIEPDRDVVKLVDNYPGWVVDSRKVELKRPKRCSPYGIPRGCPFEKIGRYRKTPFWLEAGKALEIKCLIKNRGPRCQDKATLETAKVGGRCDVEMQPVAGVN